MPVVTGADAQARHGQNKLNVPERSDSQVSEASFPGSNLSDASDLAEHSLSVDPKRKNATMAVMAMRPTRSMRLSRAPDRTSSRYGDTRPSSVGVELIDLLISLH